MIAVDGMGGDFAPHAIIQGVLQVAQEGIPILLCGPEKKLVRYLTEQCEDWEACGIQVCHAPDVIGMAEEPVIAVRKKTKSSLVRAVQVVAEGRAQAVVSSGNSGALMAAAFFLLGRQEGIERPAIAGLLPTLKGSIIALDLGANVDCRSHYLYQFAHMGVAYAQKLFSLPSPRVALLSNGAERGKGSQLIKQAANLLEESSLNFVGNVEPIDVVNHCCDVVVSDGFAGNVLLKTMEATVYMVKHALAHEFSGGGILRGEAKEKSPQVLNDAVETALENIDQRFGEKAHSGARLLGVNGIVIVGHGNAQASAVVRSLRKAWNVVQSEK